MYSAILMATMAGAPDVQAGFFAPGGCSGAHVARLQLVEVQRTRTVHRVQLVRQRGGCSGSVQKTGCSGGVVPSGLPVPMPPPPPDPPKKVTTTTTTTTTSTTTDALGEVNAQRARMGLRPFVRDDGLVRAAAAAAAYRARHLMFGHTSNDFAFVPAGTIARAAGCAAYSADHGWMSCCVDDPTATHAGAAFEVGADGKRYMHLFVR